ncbi:MAG: hypothetical protein MRY49_01480 [Candidatus Pacebacteria bacterium]|nr:hypothetical protein [Candidatus Paceibacterota bacterium]
MESLLGKRVTVDQLDFSSAVRDGHPQQLKYTGIVDGVSNNMVRLVDCKMMLRDGANHIIGSTWFNTMAHTFIAITPT